MLLLTENHRYDVDTLCERAGISRRMLYYYLESFRDWGFKVEKNGRIYSLDRESPFFKHLFETINFTEEEALTMLSILNKVEDNNAIVERLRRKLDRFYDLNILANPQLREQAAHHVGVLYDAIKRHRLVKIEGYSSPHSKSCTDRVVEPFLMMNNNNDVRCYELSSKMNKTFKVSRMGNVILLDLEWGNEAKHRQMFTDLFMFSGDERLPVRLKLDETDNNEGKAPKYWLLSMDVASYLGIARFVLGLYSHIEIIDSPGFQDFINEEIRKMYHRSL